MKEMLEAIWERGTIANTLALTAWYKGNYGVPAHRPGARKAPSCPKWVRMRLQKDCPNLYREIVDKYGTQSRII